MNDTEHKANPFTPTFGSIPPLFAGRKYVMNDILYGLKAGPGDPNRASLFVGARGSGKTALLAKIAEDASAKGWISVNVTALPGMLDDILEQAYVGARNYLAPETGSRVTGVSVGGVGIKREFIDRPQGNWRTQMNALLDALAEHSVGLLITVDEIDTTDEMRSLAATFQHFVRERREVALLLAGLPQNVSALLTDKSVSFLRRSVRHHLGIIHEKHEVRETIKRTVELSGRKISDIALEKATDASAGYPFLIQLVGYHIWRQNPEKDEIDEADADEGIRYALADMDSRILELIVSELSDLDLEFLKAMLLDEGVSQLSTIAERLDRDINTVSQYRLRLIEQGVIGSRGRGKVGFEMPMLKDYLLRNYTF